MLEGRKNTLKNLPHCLEKSTQKYVSFPFPVLIQALLLSRLEMEDVSQ